MGELAFCAWAGPGFGELHAHAAHALDFFLRTVNVGAVVSTRALACLEVAANLRLHLGSLAFP